MSDPSTPAPFIAPNPADLAPLFPGYEIEGLIATGGMGAVYAAVQKSLDRSVAIKILPPELSADEAFRIGFEAEAKAMADETTARAADAKDNTEKAKSLLEQLIQFIKDNKLNDADASDIKSPQKLAQMP